MKRLTILLSLLIILLFPTWVHAQDRSTITSVVWSHDGTRLAIGISTGVQVFNVESDTPEFLWEFESEYFGNVVQFSPSGEWLALGLGNNSLPLEQGQGIVSIFDVNTGNILSTFEANDFVVRTLAFSPDGQYLVTGGGYFPTRVYGDYRVRIWNTDNWQAVPDMEVNGRGVISALSFGLDGLFMIYSSLHSPINIIDIQTNDVVASIYQDDANCIIFDDSTNRLILNTYRSVQVWELRYEPEIHLVRQSIWRTAYSENLLEFLLGEYVIGCALDYFLTSSEDNTLRVREIETGDAVFSYFDADKRFTNASLSPDSSRVAFISDSDTPSYSGDYIADYRVGIWTLGEAQPFYIDLP